MIKLQMKNYYMILKKKQQKHYHYHPEKMVNMNLLLVKKILTPDERRMIEQAKFAYSPFRKAFEKQTKTIFNNLTQYDLLVIVFILVKLV